MIRKHVTFQTNQLAILCALALIFLTGTPTQTHAAFYKCVGANGSTRYNDTPCAAEESTHLLSKSAREVPALDCRIAHNFAYDAVARMRQDDSAMDVFDVYGGVDNIHEEARNIINYVFSFQKKPLVTARRIVDTTIKRCRSGNLGETLNRCDTYPKEFIARFGTCIKARQSDQTGLIQRLSREDALSLRTTTFGPGSAPPTLKAANPVFEELKTPDLLPDPAMMRRLEIYQQRVETPLSKHDETASEYLPEQGN